MTEGLPEGPILVFNMSAAEKYNRLMNQVIKGVIRHASVKSSAISALVGASTHSKNYRLAAQHKTCQEIIL